MTLCFYGKIIVFLTKYALYALSLCVPVNNMFTHTIVHDQELRKHSCGTNNVWEPSWITQRNNRILFIPKYSMKTYKVVLLGEGIGHS